MSFVGAGLGLTALLWLATVYARRRLHAKDAELRRLHDEHWRQHRDRMPEDWED